MSDKCKDIIGNEVNILTYSCQALLTFNKGIRSTSKGVS